MSTRATIRFKDRDEVYFVYRHHDGYPETIEPDIQRAIERSRLVSCQYAGHLVSVFLGLGFRYEQRSQNYELTSCFHGDESYRYFVEWIDGKWVLKPQEGGR